MASVLALYAQSRVESISSGHHQISLILLKLEKDFGFIFMDVNHSTEKLFRFFKQIYFTPVSKYD